MKWMYSLFFTFSVLSANSVLTFKSENMNIELFHIGTLSTQSWGMTFVNDKEMLMTLKDGKVILFNTQTQTTVLVDTLKEVLLQGQGGLLDIALSPDFEQTKKVYYSWVKATNEGAVTVLSTAIFQNNRLKSKNIIFQSNSGSNTSRHFGGRIAFDTQGNLFLSIGDRGKRNKAQDLFNHAGTIVRIDLNTYKNEIYSYGHRNPQGLVYDKQRKQLFSNEHGPRGGDEINVIKKGANYGWPIISYGKEYWAPIAVGESTHKEGMEQPLKVYTPSIAPSSLMIYHAELFPQFKGNFFSSALVLRHINRVVFNEELKPIKEERLLLELNERIRNMIHNKKGEIFFTTDSGKIYKMVPSKE
jgi:glucose/arabinose dehydrogenase